MTLFIIPFLGGHSNYYKKYKDNLEDVDVIVLDYNIYSNTFQENLEDFYTCIIRKCYAETERFSVWGHSVGALYAYELAKLFDNNDLFVGVFVSGRTAPNYNLFPEKAIVKNHKQLRKHIELNYNYSKDILDSHIGSMIVQCTTSRI